MPLADFCCALSICDNLPPFKQSLAMPLFNKKFESKPIPVRQGRCNIGHPVATEDLDDFRQISLTLGNKELRFADGIWMHSSRKGDVDDMLRLNKKFRALEEENNMCNLKIEVMLDLLAEHATELNELKPKEK
ncbi:protein chibby homolog 1 isoform X1 [Drosophila gunungcola]|uniref:protein chibby homolog 1 isoform X2 n=1 Tax=Drosophila elegans TaxID=30023 RepID=UPI0007E6D3C9|nr:protein chibby homolog 1 isoform X2 [Drosophila elegans]XP_052834762.1 protein chibby homolog 1 isoform X1 [Drosophila gunungcola]